MVLKKSNSSLNSGATQRARALEAARQAETRATCMPGSCLILAPAAPPTPAPADDKLCTRRHAQAMSTAQCMVLDYFNRDAPMLNDHGMDIAVRFGQTRLDGHVFPVHREKTDAFPSAVDRLKKDADFARELSQFVDLQIHTFSGQPLVTEGRIQRSKWSSFDLATTASLSAEEPCKKSRTSAQGPNARKGRRSKTAKARGIQRPSQMHSQKTAAARAGQSSPEGLSRPEWVLYAEVSHPEQNCARGAGLNPFIRRGTECTQAVMNKHASKKVKIREDNDAIAYGIGADFEAWYDQDQLLQEELCADVQLKANREDCLEDESTLGSHEDFNESCGAEIYEKPSSVINIFDFYQSTTQLKTPKRRRRKSSTLGSHDDDDCGSTVCSTKRCKGFVVYDPSNVHPNPPKYENDTKASYPKEVDITYIGEPTLPFSTELPTQERMDAVFRYSDPSLISVRLINTQPDNERDGVCQKSGYSVKFGNCSPACFEMHFEDTRDLWVSKYIILGREFEGHWLLSLMDSTMEIGRCSRKLNDHLKNSLESLSEALDLPQLVHFVRRVFLRVEPICLEGADKKAKTEPQVAFPNGIFRDPVDYSICTQDEAFELLSTRPNSILNLMENIHSEQAQPESQLLDECCVCYTASNDLDVHNTLLKIQPCSHTFCLMCWRQHVYHSLRDGRVDTGCLVGHCKTKVNAVMMQSLLPHFMMRRWWGLLRDKQLEVSPASAWCPECRSVIVLADDAPPGCPVSCTCGERFCHSCGHQPHWPASCEQFRAFLDSPLGKSVSDLTVTHAKDVLVRRCPKCKYPIHKDGGCNFMFCIMCRTSFFWSDTREMKRTVMNRMIIINKDAAVHYFMKCGRARSALAELTEENIEHWLDSLSWTDSDLLTFPPGVKDNEKVEIVQAIFQQAEDIVDFLKLALSFIQGIYLYFGITQQVLPHTSSKSEDVKNVNCTLVCLTEVVYKLEVKVIGRNFRNLYRSRVYHGSMLESGKAKLLQVVQLVKEWERLSDLDLDLSWLDNARLENFLRYK